MGKFITTGYLPSGCGRKNEKREGNEREKVLLVKLFFLILKEKFLVKVFTECKKVGGEMKWQQI